MDFSQSWEPGGRTSASTPGTNGEGTSHTFLFFRTWVEGGLLCHTQLTASSDPEDQSATTNKESSVHSFGPLPLCPEGYCKNLDRALFTLATRAGLVGFGSLRSGEDTSHTSEL